MAAHAIPFDAEPRSARRLPPHARAAIGVSIALLWAAFATARLARGITRPGHRSA